MWLTLLDKFKKPILLALLAILLVLSGYYLAKRTIKPEIQIKEKIVEKVVEVEKKKINSKTHTTIVTKPDGTKTETTDTETKTESETKKDSETKTEKSVVSKPNNLDKYRIGAFGDIKTSDLPNSADYGYGISAGIRVLGPVWLDTHYNIKRHELGLGASLQF